MEAAIEKIEKKKGIYKKPEKEETPTEAAKPIKDETEITEPTTTTATEITSANKETPATQSFAVRNSRYISRKVSDLFLKEPSIGVSISTPMENAVIQDSNSSLITCMHSAEGEIPLKKISSFSAEFTMPTKAIGNKKEYIGGRKASFTFSQTETKPSKT